MFLKLRQGLVIGDASDFEDGEARTLDSSDDSPSPSCLTAPLDSVHEQPDTFSNPDEHLLTLSSNSSLKHMSSVWPLTNTKQSTQSHAPHLLARSRRQKRQRDSRALGVYQAERIPHPYTTPIVDDVISSVHECQEGHTCSRAFYLRADAHVLTHDLHLVCWVLRASLAGCGTQVCHKVRRHALCYSR